MVWFGVEAGGWMWKWVCVCLSKEKRKKRGSWPKERREVGENEWWGVGLGGGTCGPQKKKCWLLLFFLIWVGRYRVPMWCMCKAWLSKFGLRCVKHTPNDQNMINKFNHGNPQSLVLIGVQNNTKMSFGHFIKHLMCTYKTNMWAMHEHE